MDFYESIIKNYLALEKLVEDGSLIFKMESVPVLFNVKKLSKY